MFLPLGDEPNPRGTPVVTWTLIGVNVAVFLLVTLPLSTIQPAFDDPVLVDYVRALAPRLSGRMELEALLQRVSAYDLVVFAHGFRPAEPSVPALATSMFLHGGFMHLAGNMLFLWIYGDNVEHRLGRWRYLAAYLGTGVLATLSHAALDPDSAVPVVGASGAVSGVLGFYFIWFPRNRVRLWIMLFPFFMNVVYAPARLVLGVYLVVDNLLPLIASRATGGGGVAYGAHIGGFAAGLAYAWWSARREIHAQPAAHEPAAHEPEAHEPAAHRAPRAVRGVGVVADLEAHHVREGAVHAPVLPAQPGADGAAADAARFPRVRPVAGQPRPCRRRARGLSAASPRLSAGSVSGRGPPRRGAGAALCAQPAGGRLSAPDVGARHRPASRDGGLRPARAVGCRQAVSARDAAPSGRVRATGSPASRAPPDATRIPRSIG